MARSRQAQIISGIAESAPSLIFLAMWRSNVDVELAGWTGAILAFSLIFGFAALRIRFDPILMGINAHMLLLAPIIHGAFVFGSADSARWLIDHAPTLVLVAIAVSMLSYQVARRPQMEDADLSPEAAYRIGWVMTAVAFAAVPWAIVNEGQSLIAVVLPIAGMFALRRYLLAREFDRRGGAAGVAVLTPADAFE